MRKVSIILLLSTIFIAYSSGQNPLFGDISKEMLSINSDIAFPDAPAIILNRSVEVEVGGYVIVKERIKILTREGYDFATIDIPHRNIVKITGQTYNLVNDNIIATELEKKMFLSSDTKNIKLSELEFFTMPQIKEGSIFEYTYKATRGTFYDIPLQFDIPVKQIKVSIRNASRYSYDILQNPKAILDLDFRAENETTYISKTNIPAFKKEKYVSHLEMYRAKLELSTTGSVKRNVFATFKNYVDNLINMDDFTNGYKPVTTYRKEISEILKGITDDEVKVKTIYNYIKAHKKWNGDYGILPDNESARFAFRKPDGDAADINMLLISVLRSVGFEANPILVSSKRNGIPLTPSDDVFNYLVAGVEIDGNLKLLDAAHNKADYNMLHNEVVNWRGLLIRDSKKFEWIDLEYQEKSKSTTMVQVKLDVDLALEGKVNYRLTGYYAAETQEALKDFSNEKFLDFSNIDKGNFEIDLLRRQSVDTLTHKSTWSYDFVNEYDVEDIAGKVYFKPMLMYGVKTNPFKSEERSYPIDFGFPKIESYIINIEIPKGYRVVSSPEPVKILMPNGVGNYTYNVSVLGQSVQVYSKLDIEESLVPIDMYGELRNFFDLRVKKEKETIVLEKI